MSPSPLACWHEAIAQNDLSPFEAVLADEAVFQSPAVHTPQVGKALVAKYLRAAMVVLNNPSFRYLDQWTQDRSAVLEFELTLDGIYVNGIDQIRWDEHGQVVSFKVMIRPLKGLQQVLLRMGTELQSRT